MTPLWLPDTPVPDQHGAFRAAFTLPHAGEVVVRLLGASWFVAWCDGVRFGEGPARFPRSHPEVQEHRLTLGAGAHVLALHAQHVGVANRLLREMPPFVLAEVRPADGTPLPLAWRCLRLDAHAARVRRVNAQLGWMEWWDTRGIPADWQAPAFDDRAWATPVPVDPGLGPLRPLSIPAVASVPLPLRPVASGTLAETFGYEHDDAPARFFLRDLAPRHVPPQGIWRRYDLGRVRLGRPSLLLDLPPGAVVEMAVSEALAQGRVSPWITLSASTSANLWHLVARGGPQRLEPLVPLGGRFLEVHLLADPARTAVLEERWLDRGYHHGPPEGSLRTGDRRLDRIWSAGVETYRACAEDAIVDNPTRERGAWTGDAVAAGMDIAAAAYSDARLAARSLRQAAWTAREDGLIPGMAVGDPIFIPSYAAAWVSGCVRQTELTGDLDLLRELFPHAERNVDAFAGQIGDDGVRDGLGWSFIDWGYVRNDGPVDIALNLHVVGALRDMERWCRLIGRDDRVARYRDLERRVAGPVGRWLEARRSEGAAGWEKIGYHAAALGLRAGFFESPDAQAQAVAFVQNHLRRCFPNDPSAPRLSDPAVSERRLITPYFAHYAFPPLIERGEMDFVLDQIRRCWGWMLDTGATTILEVFDTRWSHCHQWSACPTWQMSRYLLGLQPRFDRGARHYAAVLQPGSLPRASGTLPIPGGGAIRVSWTRRGDGRILWKIVTPQRLWLDFGDGASVDVDGAWSVVLHRRDNRWVPA